MVGTDDAVCLDRRIVGRGNTAGLRGAQVEILKTHPLTLCIIYLKLGKTSEFSP